MNSVANNYNRKKIVFSHGKGIYLFTNDGERYIDLAAGIAVNLLGHSNKDLINVFPLLATPPVPTALAISSFSRSIFPPGMLLGVESIRSLHNIFRTPVE